MRLLLDTTYARRAPYSGTAVYLDRIVPALASARGRDRGRRPTRAAAPGRAAGRAASRNLATDAWWAAVETAPRARAATAPRSSTTRSRPRAARRRPAGGHRPRPRVRAAAGAFRRGYRTYAHLAHRAAARAAAAVDVRERDDGRRRPRAVGGARREDRRRAARAGAGAADLRASTCPEPPPLHRRRRAAQEPRRCCSRPTRATGPPLPSPVRCRSSSPGLRASGSRRPPASARSDAPGRAELAELLAGAVALVHPSLYEGFGMTALEAMRAGVPVIAARSPGIVEVCGGAAAYVDPRDPEAFARALAGVAADPSRRATLSAAGRAGPPRSAGRSVQCVTPRHTISRCAHEDRDPGHAGHSRLVQRLRDGGGAAHLAPDRPRPRGHRVLPLARRRPLASPPTRAPSSSTCARSRTSTSTRSCTRSARPCTPPA